jgi:hypothetical protein
MIETIYSSAMFGLPELGICREGRFKGWLMVRGGDGQWVSLADLRPHVRCPTTHEAADAFWQHWRENGETHKHGYYESTWGAINRAIRMVGVVEHDYWPDHAEAYPAPVSPSPSGDSAIPRRWSLARDGFGVERNDDSGEYVLYSDVASASADSTSLPSTPEDVIAMISSHYIAQRTHTDAGAPLALDDVTYSLTVHDLLSALSDWKEFRVTADSAADAHGTWNPTDKELVAMMEDARDAARYRWLRQKRDIPHGERGIPWAVQLDKAARIHTMIGCFDIDLDHAIDAASAAMHPTTGKEES